MARHAFVQTPLLWLLRSKELPFHPKRSMVLLVGLILLALSGVRGFSHENAPRLNGEHFRITVAKEDGFVNVDESSHEEVIFGDELILVNIFV